MASRTELRNRDARLQLKAEDQQLEQAASKTREHKLVMLSAAQRTKAAKASAEAPAPKGKGKNVKAAATPKPKKAATNGEARTTRARKEGLRKPQVRILAYLATLTTTQWVRRKQISEGAKVDAAWIGDHVGSYDAADREKRDTVTGHPSLISLGHVRIKEIDSDGKKEFVHQITAEGRKAAKDAAKAE